MNASISLFAMTAVVVLAGCVGNASPTDDVAGHSEGAITSRTVESVPDDEASASPRQRAAGDSVALAKIYMTSTANVRSHRTPDTSVASRAGILYAGRNYYYCYTSGETVSDNGRTSEYWLKTDDDSGNRNVYITDVYLDQAGWENDLLWLPRC